MSHGWCWQPLAGSEELARIEVKVRRGEELTEVEFIRYEAYVSIRLEQIWTMYQLHKEGVISTEEYTSSLEPSRDRATRDEVFVEIVRRAPMPDDLRRDLLGG